MAVHNGRGASPLQKTSKKLMARECGRGEAITDETPEDRDRALYKIMINERWPHEDVIKIIATGDRGKLDEALTKLRADANRRARDVEIIPPDQMVDGVVHLNARKIQAEMDRYQKEADAEDAHWEQTRNQLIAVMQASEQASLGLISATLSALLRVLLAEGNDEVEAKKKIAKVLSVFR